MIICVASSECPPSAKKSSKTPTRSTPRRSAQIAAISSSSASRGATYSASRCAWIEAGSGSARRSTFPLGVNGSASRLANADGTM